MERKVTVSVNRHKNLDDMAHEVRLLNIEKGWREKDGSTTNTFGDMVALLHSEVSEALEAFRTWRLEDATSLRLPTLQEPLLPKPEGVGSELADILIRLLDMCDLYGIDLNYEYERKMAYNRTRRHRHGGRTL
jgi:NTP pyrophosphatase (non-canonical NTP hydrolase)